MEDAEEPDKQRLDLNQVMDRRRRELRRTWAEIARGAGMTVENLLRIRKGQISISWRAADGIEDAMQWERGSVEAAVTHGIPPTVKADVRPTRDEPPQSRAVAWTAEMEAFYQILKAKLNSEGLEMNEANVLSSIDQLRIELTRRVNRKDRLPDDSR